MKVLHIYNNLTGEWGLARSISCFSVRPLSLKLRAV